MYDIQPRVLTVAEAAKYVGAKSVRQFRREVNRGIWPQPIARFSRPQRWSVLQLEKALGPVNDNADPEIVKLEQTLGMA
jgi:hypothetical protein